MNSTAQHHHTDDNDWAAMGADLELEGDVFRPMLTETLSWVGKISHDRGTQVRRIIDIGSGPGVGTCELARHFGHATVVAVDGSAALLERANHRAGSLGLSDRIRTCRADLPDGAGLAGTADLVWASMVLHHVGDPTATLIRLREQLNPGGLIVVTEFGSPRRFLPDDIHIGRPGLQERLDQAGVDRPVTMHSGLPHGSPGADFASAVPATDLEIVAERRVSIHLEAPLTYGARRVVLGHLRRMCRLLTDGIDEADWATLDILVDEESPHGVMKRPDVHLDASRHVYVLRANEAVVERDQV